MIIYGPNVIIYGPYMIMMPADRSGIYLKAYFQLRIELKTEAIQRKQGVFNSDHDAPKIGCFISFI